MSFKSLTLRSSVLLISALCAQPSLATSTYTVADPLESATAFAATSDAIALDIAILTGDDDLRGGNDNAFINVFLRDGRVISGSINGTSRLADRSVHWFRVAIPGGADVALFSHFEIVATLGGGIGGDNWNIDQVFIQTVNEAGSQVIFNQFNRPLVRLTGDQPSIVFGF
jgi:hypothetical protein